MTLTADNQAAAAAGSSASVQGQATASAVQGEGMVCVQVRKGISRFFSFRPKLIAVTEESEL